MPLFKNNYSHKISLYNFLKRFKLSPSMFSSHNGIKLEINSTRKAEKLMIGGIE